MAKNYMSNIAKMLGVELGEEFVLNTGYCDTRYKFTHDGLAVQCEKNGVWYRARDVEEGLLFGKFEIVKLPWKPKESEPYWYVGWRKHGEEWDIRPYRTVYTCTSPCSTMATDAGNCFKTLEEAKAAVYEVFKRLTGKDWHETYGKEGGNNAVD